MHLKNIRIIITMFLCFLFISMSVWAGNQDNTLSKALVLFDAGNYAEAEPILKELLDKNPNHLIVNYYYGACRTENEHYGIEEIVFLLNGSVGEAPLQTDYYLGVQYHAKNSWEEALRYYNSFKENTDAETQKEYHLADKIQMCQNKVNPFAKDTVAEVVKDTSNDVMPIAIPREEELEEFNPVINKSGIVDDTVNGTIEGVSDVVDSVRVISENDTSIVEKTVDSLKIIDDVLPKSEKVKKVSALINFIVNSEITYPDTSFFKTAKGLKFYSQQIAKQKELDEKTAHVDELRKKYGHANSYSEKKSLGELIINGETDIYKLQDETAELLTKARKAENDYWQKASDEDKSAIKESIKAYSETAYHEVDQAEENISPVITSSVLYEDVEPAVTEEKNKKDELIYKIQIGAYSHGIPSYRKSLFKKLSYIRKIDNYTDEKGVVVYTTGNLTNYDDALKMQEQVRQEGVKDAFIVPYFNKKRISLKEAKEIETEK